MHFIPLRIISCLAGFANARRVAPVFVDVNLTGTLGARDCIPFRHWEFSRLPYKYTPRSISRHSLRGLRFCDSQSAAKLFVKSYGHVGREFKLRPFSAGSILTLRKRIETPASTTSVERTPRKMQSTKLAPSIIAPGNVPNPRRGCQHKARKPQVRVGKMNRARGGGDSRFFCD